MAEHAGFSLNIWDNDNDFLQGEKDRLMAQDSEHNIKDQKI